jgi:hypothetical protein
MKEEGRRKKEEGIILFSSCQTALPEVIHKVYITIDNRIYYLR